MKRKPKKRKRWIWLLVILAVVAAAAVFVVRNISAQADAIAQAMSAQEQTYTVERGMLEKTITATGALSAADETYVKLPNGLLLDELLVTAGEPVREGQILARFSPESVSEQFAYLAKKAVEEDNRLDTPGNADSVKVPAKGRVKYLPVKEGDDVLTAMQTYGVLAILSSDGWMQLSIETDRALTIGSRMVVRWDGGRVMGTVDRKTDTGYSILVPDEHAPYLGRATLMDGNTEIGSGTLQINMPVEVVGYDGVIRTIRYNLDASTPDGRELFGLKNASVSVSFATRYATRVKYLDLFKRVIALSGKPYVTAPCDGVVSEILFKENEVVGKAANADADSVVFKLGVGGAGKLTVNIDELDILSVVPGQQATVSLDALPNETLTAEVTRISAVGKKENSISTFPAELTIPYDARLMAGMNGTATILVDRAENVLLVPLDAVEEDAEGEFVYVLGQNGDKVRTKIATGRSNSDMAEVTEGLSDGDVISYTASAMGGMGFYGATVMVG